MRQVRISAMPHRLSVRCSCGQMPSGRPGAHTSISAEISAEIEVCAPERPEGIWPHEQRTLNLWGMALMRT